MKESLKQLDYFLFDLINQRLAVPMLDEFFKFIRNPFYLQIIYVCFALFLVIKFKKKSIVFIFLFIVAMSLADLVSSHFFKVYFHRLRPCLEPLMDGHMRHLIPCSSGYSFTSSHAATNMSVAVLYAFILPYTFNKFKIGFIVFACMVGYAQIYVGVHYPFDVLGGLLTGGSIGAVCGWAYHQYEKRRHLHTFENTVEA